MSNDNGQNATPQPAPEEPQKETPQPIELPEPNKGETVTKGG